MSDQLGKSLQHSVNQKFGRGTYRVLEPIKRGKDGYVYKIQFIKEKRLGALKVLPKSSLNIEIQFDDKEQYKKKYKHDTNLERKAQNQIKIHSSMRSSYIVKLQNWSSDDMNFYLVLQYISKGDLADQIRASKTGINITRIKKIGLQLAKGIDTIHKKNIVHRDIKPQNILLTEEDEIKICDFSCASYIQTKKNQYLQGAIGTLQYMAPQILGKYNNSVDIWSYGCVLYAMCTGQPPFKLQNYILGEYIKKVNESSIKKLGKRILQNIKQNVVKNSLKYSCLQNNCQCKNQEHQECYRKLANLLRKILLADSNNRVSMSEIIKHPFFTGQILEQQEQQQQTDKKGYVNQKQIKDQIKLNKPKLITQQNQDNNQNDNKETNKAKRQIKIAQSKQIKVGKKQQKKHIQNQQDTKTLLNRPKTSYSLESMKKYLNHEQKQKIIEQRQKKTFRNTQQVIQKHKQKYNLTSNLMLNSNKNYNFNNKTENGNPYRRDQHPEQAKNMNKNKTYLTINNQNVNILNVGHNKDGSNRNQANQIYQNYVSSKGSDIDQIIKYKLSDKQKNGHKNEDYHVQINQKKPNSNKYIGDSNPYNGQSVPHSINSSSYISQSQVRGIQTQPLNCEGITYSAQLNCQELVTINEMGLKGQFIKSGKSILISPKGRHITVKVGDKSKNYQLEKLPQKYLTFYRDYKGIVQGAKKLKKNKQTNSRMHNRVTQQLNNNQDQNLQQRKTRICKTSRQKIQLQQQDPKNAQRPKSINKLMNENQRIQGNGRSESRKQLKINVKPVSYVDIQLEIYVEKQVLNKLGVACTLGDGSLLEYTVRMEVGDSNNNKKVYLSLIPKNNHQNSSKNALHPLQKQSQQISSEQYRHQVASKLIELIICSSYPQLSNSSQMANTLKKHIRHQNQKILQLVVSQIVRPNKAGQDIVYRDSVSGNGYKKEQALANEQILQGLEYRSSRNNSQNKYNKNMINTHNPHNTNNCISNSIGISRQLQQRERLREQQKQRQRERQAQIHGTGNRQQQHYNHRALLNSQSYNYR